MRSALLLSVLLSGLFLLGCTEKMPGAEPDNPTFSEERHLALADCLTKKGWVMYASNTCSVCRAQRQAFGAAFSSITEIECNPHAPDSRTKLCVEKNILKFPTWIREKDGQKGKRLEGFHSLEDLASLSGCRTGDPEPGKGKDAAK